MKHQLYLVIRCLLHFQTLITLIEEDRYLIIGLSSNNRTLVVSHTYRNGSIRIISARLATKREQSFYEYN